MKVIGIIPARGGSKGIPLKNLAPCNGKPLLYWTIREAKRSSLDALYVSTDHQQIAECAADQGVEVLWRPAHLATDTARTIDVLRDLSGLLSKYDAVFTLQPTNPLRTWQMIDGACAALESSDATSVISFTDVGERHPDRMYVKQDWELSDETFQPQRCQPYMRPHRCNHEESWRRRQDLCQLYVRTGEVYATRTKTILAGSIDGGICMPWILNKGECWNVDDETDLLIVEALMKARG